MKEKIYKKEEVVEMLVEYEDILRNWDRQGSAVAYILVNIAKDIINNSPQRIKSEVIKSQLVLDKIEKLFEYAVEIMSLASHNEKSAKTNGMLLRVLIETLSNIALISKLLSENKTREIQNDIFFGFELKFIEDKHTEWGRRKSALKERGVAEKTDTETTLIKNTKSTVEKNEKIASDREEEIKGKIHNKELVNFIVRENKHVYNKLENSHSKAFNKNVVFRLSELYRNCNIYVHPDHYFA